MIEILNSSALSPMLSKEEGCCLPYGFANFYPPLSVSIFIQSSESLIRVLVGHKSLGEALWEREKKESKKKPLFRAK